MRERTSKLGGKWKARVARLKQHMRERRAKRKMRLSKWKSQIASSTEAIAKYEKKSRDRRVGMRHRNRRERAHKRRAAINALKRKMLHANSLAKEDLQALSLKLKRLQDEDIQEAKMRKARRATRKRALKLKLQSIQRSETRKALALKHKAQALKLMLAREEEIAK